MNEPTINLRPIQFQFPPFKMENWEKWKVELFQRLKFAAKLRIPHLPELLPCEGRAVVAGSAPSVINYVDMIKGFNEELDILVSINGSHDWLIKNVRPPNIHLLYESDVELETSLGGPPHKDVVYYTCSQCPSHIFEQLRGYRCVLWHVFREHQEYQNYIARLFKGDFMVTGGWGSLFRSINVAIVLGYRKFELFGVDSSFEGEDDHIPGYKTANVEQRYNIWGVDDITREARKFRSNGSLAFQAYEFLRFCEVNQEYLSMRVYGDGLLRYVHKSRYPEQYESDEQS